MIRIVRRAKEPAALARARATHLPNVTAHTLGKDIKGYGVAKKDLAAMQRLLCAYCEVRHMTEKWRDVEHYRPKSAYPWLAWTWENLLFACKECNSEAKGDQFPIRGTKLAFKQDPPGLENADLLDPSVDGFDFRDHIQFRKVTLTTTNGFQVPAPRLTVMPNVYDIEGLRRYTDTFEPGEAYVCTEKIHGQNARFVHDGEKLHVGSRNRWLTTEERNTWSDVAARYGLAAKLAKRPKVVFFGETYGNNSDMPYGVERGKTGDELRFFDAFCSETGRWYDHDEFRAACDELGLAVVPELCRGVWSEGEFAKLLPLAEGTTTLVAGKGHVREGFVIRPLKERNMRGPTAGRLILKLHGEGYLTRKGA